MRIFLEKYWRLTASERLAIVILALGISVKVVMIAGFDDNVLSLVMFVLALMVTGLLSLVMLFVGGRGHSSFWRRALDRILPLATWGLVFGLLSLTRDLT